MVGLKEIVTSKGNCFVKKSRNITGLCVMVKSNEMIFLLNLVISLGGNLDNPGAAGMTTHLTNLSDKFILLKTSRRQKHSQRIEE